MLNNIKYFMASLVITLAIAIPQKSQAMEVESMDVENKEAFKSTCSADFPSDINLLIIKECFFDQCDTFGNINNLKFVSKEWKDLVEAINTPLIDNHFYHSPLNLEESCLLDLFCKGKLIYKKGDVEYEFRIADLTNPLAGTFNISVCGDVGNYLSINTGYRTGKKLDNANKVEIWLAPRFIIKKELATTAYHFKDIFPNWKPNNHVGLFWTWGNWDNLNWYDYLVTENMINLSKINLYELWNNSFPSRPYRLPGTYIQNTSFAPTFCPFDPFMFHL